jgi:hypothetical protein
MEEQSETMEENANHEDDLMPLCDPTKSGEASFLPVGLSLQIEIGGISTNMSSVFVGNSADDCLIITYPSTDALGSITSKLSKGNRITVQFISDGDVFSFRSELLGIISAPVGLLFIAYPALIVRHSPESNRGAECHLPADLRFDSRARDLDTIHDGVVTDIGIAGCKFNMVQVWSEYMPLDDSVLVGLQLPGIENRIELSGTIRNVQMDSRKTSMEIQFNEIDEDKKMRIIDFISTLENSAGN